MRYLLAFILILILVVGIVGAFVLPPPPIDSQQCEPFVKFDVTAWPDNSSEWTQRNLVREKFPDGPDGDVVVCRYGERFKNGFSIPYIDDELSLP